ncbi:SEC-C metal-binding domain-containing protein [Aquibacillus saliphilus]|uniref:SEC-C metal-binding domain-containing protein n=1 Tax=Aquibacillus saliphilus TaxID=1909422 RepID=UPI001CEFDD3A|nr:SEC-C metal-binding domain-containing protein [Aquibacillus saliphilus]
MINEKLNNGNDWITEQAEKRHKKLWSEITIPISLEERLSTYTKYELDLIRKNLDLKGVSGLKKADLISVLLEKIPEHLGAIYQTWDSERLTFLLKIVESGGKIMNPSLGLDQIDYFRMTGLVYTGTYQGEKIVAVPDELVVPIKAMKNDLNVRATVKRNSEWLKLSHGLLYYYGTLSSTQLIDMIEAYSKEAVDIREYFRVIHNSNEYMEHFQIDVHGFSNQAVVNPETVIEEHERRKDLPFYPFSKQQLLAAGDPEFIEKNKSYLQLVKYLTQAFEISKEAVDEIVEECVFDILNGSEPNHILENLSNIFELGGSKQAQALMDRVVYLMNNTRQWRLKGYSPNELAKQERKYLNPLQATSHKHDEPNKTVKVGRNEPCPCGSGKKYKKCCGR